MIPRHLLAMTGIIGGGTSLGYTMSADEVTYWQEQAALLDPDAYEYVNGTSQSRTVTTDERWYLVNGWQLAASGAGTTWFHRPADVDHALLLSEGTTIQTHDSTVGGSNPFMYLCKPSLVTSGDSRYTDDPRSLYFDRIMRLGELTQYRIGGTNTGASTSDVAFPTDFTDGFVIHVSTHSLAWIIMVTASDGGGLNTLNEISDSAQMRFAERVYFPFKRTTFPEIRLMGASQSEGRGTVTYVKLPADW